MTPLDRLLPGHLLPARLLGGTAHSSTTAPSGPSYVLGHPGRPARTPTLVIAVFDNSGSVTWPAGTDPMSNRYAEVARAIAVVAKHGSTQELAAVLHFDVPSSGEIPPTPLTRSGLKQLQQGLHRPPDGAGSSRLAPSLTRAIDLAATHPGHQATLILLSDFQLLDPEPAAVLARLGAFPGTVHAVVLGGRHAATDFPPNVIVTGVRPHDPPGAVARAVFASLTRYRPGSRAYRAATAAPTVANSTTELTRSTAEPKPLH